MNTCQEGLEHESTNFDGEGNAAIYISLEGQFVVYVLSAVHNLRGRGIDTEAEKGYSILPYFNSVIMHKRYRAHAYGGQEGPFIHNLVVSNLNIPIWISCVYCHSQTAVAYCYSEKETHVLMAVKNLLLKS